MIIIDSHAHTGYWPTLKACETNLIKSVRNFNIDYTLFSFDGIEFVDQNSSRTRLTNQVIGFNNAYKFYEQNPKKFGILLWIRPHTEKNYQEVELFINNHLDAIKGIKIQPRNSRLKVDDPLIVPYLKLAEKYNYPVLVHTAEDDDYSSLDNLKKVAKSWPHLLFIAAHAGNRTDHKKCIKIMKECPNILADTAWVEMQDIKLFKEANLMDRIMFGTDNPIKGADHLKRQIYQDYFNNVINLEKEDYEKLMYKNAIRVYNLKLK